MSVGTITLIVVTSPSPSNPSIDMISRVINSFERNIEGISESAVLIICDGFKIADVNRTKKGRINLQSKGSLHTCTG